jgi:ABC-type multidrug transport system fused ATPase/permease subunit
LELAHGKRRALILLYLLVLGSAAMESIGIAAFYPIVDMLQDVSQLDYYRDKCIALVPALKSLSREQFLSFALLGVVALFVFKNAFLVLAGYGNIRVVTHLYCAWMNRIFQIYLGKPYTFFLENKAGDLVQRKILQTQKASGALKILIMLLGSLTTVVGVTLVLSFMNLKITLAITILLIPAYYFTMKISQGKVYKSGDRITELEKHGFGLTTEVLSGIKQIKVFCAEEHFQHRVGKIWNEYSRHCIQNQFLATLPRPVLETLVVFAGVGVLFVLMKFSGPGKEVFPMLTVFAVGMYRILPLASAASAQVMAFASILPSVEIVAGILGDSSKEKTGLTLPTMMEKIEFKNISFSYDGRKNVLEDLSLKFENKKFYGIVGVSGSGKSTIIDLIAGFFKPQKGQVLVDGVDIKNANINTWLRQVGIISQDAFIFSGTIDDNICFGIDIEDRDQNRIKEAAQIAYVDEFIDPLPEGYQTVVGERGVKLSGGQRQRLAIARAIYLDPPVLIFDEATSSLDANSERKIQEAIETLHGKRTVIVVAHRLATVASADTIYVLENGGLAEEGTHEQLKAGNGLYSRLCVKQSLK